MPFVRVLSDVVFVRCSPTVSGGGSFRVYSMHLQVLFCIPFKVGVERDPRFRSGKEGFRGLI